jgi:hypothetical protein
LSVGAMHQQQQPLLERTIQQHHHYQSNKSYTHNLVELPLKVWKKQCTWKMFAFSLKIHEQTTYYMKIHISNIRSWGKREITIHKCEHTRKRIMIYLT